MGHHKSCKKESRCCKKSSRCSELSPCVRVLDRKYRDHQEFSVRDSKQNILGYKYDYLCPAYTVQAGGLHWQ